MIESWIGGFFEIVWQEAAIFAIMIAVLCLRPEGHLQTRSDAGRMKLLRRHRRGSARRRFAVAHVLELLHRHCALGLHLHGRCRRAQSGLWLCWAVVVRAARVLGHRRLRAALTVMTFGGSFWLGLLCAALINAAVAVAIGFPALRTNRHAFVMTPWRLRCS